MTKTKRIIVLISIIIVFAYLLALLLLTGWNEAVKAMEGFWLDEKFLAKTALAYTAPRLWEMPVERQIQEIFGKDAKMAEAIFRAESGLNCNAVSETNDIGIAQIHPRYHAKRALKWNGNLMDCTTNLRVAKEIFDEQGWTPWSAYQNGSYRKYLN